MFTFKSIALCASVLTIAPAALAQAPQFGQPIAPADIAAWDISIGPDGVGLPPGRGTAIEGEAVYVAKCQACHGEKGMRPSAPLAGALVGGFEEVRIHAARHLEIRCKTWFDRHRSQRAPENGLFLRVRSAHVQVIEFHLRLGLA